MENKQIPIMEKTLLRINEVREYLPYSKSKIYELIRKKRLQTIKKGFSLFIHNKSLFDYIDSIIVPIPKNEGKSKNNIYFIQAENGLIKIGQTINVKTRFKNLKLNSPLSLKLLVSIPADYIYEFKIHEHFKKIRSHNEWFNPAPELLIFIEKIKKLSKNLPDSTI